MMHVPKKNIFYKPMFAFSGVLFITFCAEISAAPSNSFTNIPRPGCGDYSILHSLSDRSKLENHCGSNDDADRVVMINTINRLNPLHEANAAANRGDFRLAALIGGGPPPPGKVRFWHIAGIACKNLNDKDVVYWLGMSDALYSPAHGELQGSMTRFAKSYNKALIAEKNFPENFGCEINISKKGK